MSSEKGTLFLSPLSTSSTPADPAFALVDDCRAQYGRHSGKLPHLFPHRHRPRNMEQEAAHSTPTTAGLSLVELRRHLIRRASAMRVRARGLRARGDRLAAARLEDQSARLIRVARDMRVRRTS
jgi:hypothetical protein